MSGLFKPPSMPKVKPPTPLPDAQQMERATKRDRIRQTKGDGVQSTMLQSGARETFGG